MGYRESLYPLVIQRPDPSFKKPYCPNCRSSRSLYTKGVYHSLGGLLSGDDHIIHKMQCGSCQTCITFESKSGQNWETCDNGKVVAGFPNCWEPYVYTCTHCLSDVKRVIRNKEDDSETSYYVHEHSQGKSFSKQYYSYECTVCGESVSVSGTELI